MVESLLQAEESGVSQAGVSTNVKTTDPVVRRLLGTQKGYAQYLALDDALAVHMIEAVGNYGEIFAKDLGSQSVMRIARGPNDLWTRGGLMYEAPLR